MDHISVSIPVLMFNVKGYGFFPKVFPTRPHKLSFNKVWSCCGCASLRLCKFNFIYSTWMYDRWNNIPHYTMLFCVPQIWTFRIVLLSRHVAFLFLIVDCRSNASPSGARIKFWKGFSFGPHFSITAPALTPLLVNGDKLFMFISIPMWPFDSRIVIRQSLDKKHYDFHWSTIIRLIL